MELALKSPIGHWFIIASTIAIYLLYTIYNYSSPNGPTSRFTGLAVMFYAARRMSPSGFWVVVLLHWLVNVITDGCSSSIKRDTSSCSDPSLSLPGSKCPGDR